MKTLMFLSEPTDAQLDCFLDNTHTLACAVMAGWVAYYLLTKHRQTR
jgi:hypothetical protein